MQCPVCKEVTLVMSERQGVEIDYCPSCRGVWLDRGELDKIIERATPVETSSAARALTEAEGRGREGREGWREHDDDDDEHGGYGHGHGRRRRKGFLGDLFDLG